MISISFFDGGALGIPLAVEGLLARRLEEAGVAGFGLYCLIDLSFDSDDSVAGCLDIFCKLLD